MSFPEKKKFDGLMWQTFAVCPVHTDFPLLQNGNYCPLCKHVVSKARRTRIWDTFKGEDTMVFESGHWKDEAKLS